jgi:hypothetical protein
VGASRWDQAAVVCLPFCLGAVAVDEDGTGRACERSVSCDAESSSARR